jgi:hypothetical protein
VQVEEKKDNSAELAMRATNDALVKAIGAMKRLAEDYQQLGWQTHDNEKEAMTTLQALHAFIAECAPDSLLVETMANYKLVDVLVAYYLADTRRNCRVLAIQMLGALGSLLQQSAAQRAMALAMPSALAVDVVRLARDNDDSEFLMYSALFLTALLGAAQSDDDDTPLFSSLRTPIGDDESVSALLHALFARIEAGCDGVSAARQNVPLSQVSVAIEGTDQILCVGRAGCAGAVHRAQRQTTAHVARRRRRRAAQRCALSAAGRACCRQIQRSGRGWWGGGEGRGRMRAHMRDDCV